MTESMLESNCYQVRTLDTLVERGIVGVGWSEFDFSSYSDAEAAIQAIRDDWGGVGRSANQIRRFFAIQDGDIVVAPIPYAVAIGVSRGGIRYDADSVGVDRANQRRVDFPRDPEGRVITIPRTALSEAFQRRLRVQGMTVNDLNEFAEEIQAIRQSQSDGKSYDWADSVRTQQKEKLESFRKRLLDNIQSGRTNLPTGGIGLQDLVQELLTLEGYEARVLSTRHFSSYADADVQASRSDRCAVVKLLIQVKHHQGFTNEHGIRQLAEIRRAHPGEYDDHQHVFLTSASVSDELRIEATKADVTVIDGAALAEWIGDSIQKLRPETKLTLGIYEVPAVI